MTASHPIVPGVTFKAIGRFPGYAFGSDGSCWTRWKQVFYGAGSRNEIGDSWRKLKANQGSGDYRVFAIRSQDDRWRRKYQVHRLILEAFVGPCPEGMEGCHNDGDPRNNSVDNLRWDTPKNNTADKHRHGTMSVGSRSHFAKLTEGEVVEIKRLRSEGVATKDVAARFGVDRDSVSRILSRKTWQHVP